MAEQKNENNNQNNNGTENKKFSVKEKIRSFKEKHPKVTKGLVYAGCVGAGALVAVGGKPILDALGLTKKDGFPEGEPTEQYEETEKEEEKE